MIYRLVLVAVGNEDSSASAIDAALTVGKTFGAHVVGLHVRADSKDAVPLLGEGMSGAMIEEIVDLAEKESSKRAVTARKVFDERCARAGAPIIAAPPAPNTLSAVWVEEVGREDETLGRRGRLSDLIVVSRPRPQDEAAPALTLNAALFETGRPVLVVPSAPTTIGRRIAISWNGSPQAARAISGAMPFLERAESVTILTVETDRTSTVRSGELAEYLAWRGIKASAPAIVLSGRDVGEAILRACADAGADLLVMGAYSQPRLRRLIYGGVTQHMLNEATIPIVMGY